MAKYVVEVSGEIEVEADGEKEAIAAAREMIGECIDNCLFFDAEMLEPDDDDDDDDDEI
jgi:hypothetical protein